MAQQPIKAPDSTPFYKLTNFRVEEDSFGRTSVLCNYERTRQGDGSHHEIRIVARTENGEIDIMGFDSISELDKKSGEIGLSNFFQFGRNRAFNYEIYLVTDARWAGRTYGPCMVSNSVRMGSPGPATVARPWNVDEKSAFEKHELGKLPPKTKPPNVFEMANLSTKLLPGMYVMAGEYGDWKKAEFLGFTDNREASLRFEGQTKVVTRPVEKWVAVDPTDLKKAETNPEAFQPSGVVLKGGNLLIPPDSIPLNGSIRLVPGTPLLYERGGGWTEVIFVKKIGTSLRFSFNIGPSPTISLTEPTTRFAIKTSTLDQLSKPEIAATFAENLKENEESNITDFLGNHDVGSDFREAMEELKKAQRNHLRRDYEIKSPIPKDCQLVPADLKIPVGTKVAACFHFDWSAATVLAENDDGTLEIDWDEHASAWNGPVARNQLIIQNKTLKKIKRDSAMTPAEFAKITRTWTDSSGQHTFEANFVSKTDKEVTLRSKDGFEKTLPIAKLCEGDRKLLASLKQETENPFAR